MKKLFIIIIILSLITIIGLAKLNDETLKAVETLRNKYYFNGIDITELLCSDNCMIANNFIEWTQDFLNIWVKDGKLFIETQDGKWFIEMEKIE